MIKVTVTENDHSVDIQFPCSEIVLQRALMEIRSDDGFPEKHIDYVIYPRELDFLEGLRINLDQLNYLAKRMECFYGCEECQFYEAIKHEGFTEMKDLINLSFNLNKYFIIQNVGDMGKIGREYLLNRDGCIPYDDCDNPEYAEIGRQLMNSGSAIVTDHGLLFIDEDIPFREEFDGQVFPPYVYNSDTVCAVTAEYEGKTEYLYFPCERLAITKAIDRLGYPDIEDVDIKLHDFILYNSDWHDRINSYIATESIYDVNELTEAINKSGRQLDKLTAAVEYAKANDIKSVIALCNMIDLFVVIDDANTNEDVGRFFAKNSFYYIVPENVKPFIDYNLMGEHISAIYDGRFISSGFVCMSEGYSLDMFLDIDNMNLSEIREFE